MKHKHNDITLSLRGDIDEVHLGKVVVSVFLGQPSKDKVLIDVEVLRYDGSRGSIAVSTNCPDSKQRIHTKSPYEEQEPLLCYLGSGAEKRDGAWHIDETEGEIHVVRHGTSELEENQPDSSSRAFVLGPAQPKPVFVGQKPDQPPPQDKVPISQADDKVVKHVIGDWFGIVRGWAGTRNTHDGDPINIDVVFENATCHGLYVWCFPPRGHDYQASSSTFQEEDSVGSLSGVTHRVSSKPDFVEFTIWKNKAKGRVFARHNAVSWTSTTRHAILFSASIESRSRREKSRDRNFILGAALSLCAAFGVQAIGIALTTDNAETHDTMVVYAVLLGFLFAFGCTAGYAWAKA